MVVHVLFAGGNVRLSKLSWRFCTMRTMMSWRATQIIKQSIASLAVRFLPRLAQGLFLVASTWKGCCQRPQLYQRLRSLLRLLPARNNSRRPRLDAVLPKRLLSHSLLLTKRQQRPKIHIIRIVLRVHTILIHIIIRIITIIQHP